MALFVARFYFWWPRHFFAILVGSTGVFFSAQHWVGCVRTPFKYFTRLRRSPQGKASSVCDPGQSGNWGYASEPARVSIHTPKSRPFILTLQDKELGEDK